MKSLMSVNAMIDLYVHYGVDEETWKMLYEMACHHLISADNWIKFSDTCKSWTVEGNRIIDTATARTIYMTDEFGFWEKA